MSNRNDKNTIQISKMIIYVFPVIVLLCAYTIYSLTFSPVLTDVMSSEIAYARYISANNGFFWTSGWKSTRVFFPFSVRFFMTLFSGLDNWKHVLFVGVSFSYLIYCLSFISLYFQLKLAKPTFKIIVTIISGLIGFISLIATYSCSNLISYMSFIFILVAIFLFTKPKKNLYKSLILIPIVALIFFEFLFVKTNGNIASLNEVINSFSFTFNWKSLSDNKLSVTEYLLHNKTEQFYTTENFRNYIEVSSNGECAAYVYSKIETLDLITTTDEPSDYTKLDNLPNKEVIVLVPTKSIDNYSKYYDKIYSDECYSLLLYKTIGLFNNQEEIKNLSELENNEFNYLFLSTVDNGCTQEMYDHLGYLTGKTCASSVKLTYLEDATEYIDKLHKSITFSDCILRLDPMDIYTSNNYDYSAYTMNLDSTLCRILRENPQITFHIELPTYCITKYMNIDDTDEINMRTSYSVFADTISSYSNCDIHYFAYDYVYENEYLYEASSSICLIPEISKELLIQNYGCKNYIVDNPITVIKMLEQELEEAKSFSSTKESPINDTACLVIFGDSIFGNWSDASSIQSIINNYSTSYVICEAIGGAHASIPFNKTEPFDSQLSNIDEIDSKINATNLSTSNIIFAFEFGLNDYFSGINLTNKTDIYDIYSFEGSMKTGIEKIKSKYPNAQLIIMVPGIISMNNYGDELINGQNTLEDYRNILRNLAKEYNAKIFDLSADTGISKNNFYIYSNDEVHYNISGRFLIANKFIEFYNREYTNE